MKRVLSALAVVAAAWSVAGSASANPSNLCALKVKPQLEPLHVAAICKPSKTARIASLTIVGADWGAANNYVGVQVYIGAPESRFKQQFGKLGKPVSLGSFAREDIGASGVSVSAWVNGKGLVVLLNKGLRTPSAMKPYAASLLAFAKAVAKQI
jgi:hypothetical protein